MGTASAPHLARKAFARRWLPAAVLRYLRYTERKLLIPIVWVGIGVYRYWTLGVLLESRISRELQIRQTDAADRNLVGHDVCCRLESDIGLGRVVIILLDTVARNSKRPHQFPVFVERYAAREENDPALVRKVRHLVAVRTRVSCVVLIKLKKWASTAAVDARRK